MSSVQSHENEELCENQVNFSITNCSCFCLLLKEGCQIEDLARRMMKLNDNPITRQ